VVFWTTQASRRQAQPEILLHQFSHPPQEVVAHLVVGPLLQMPFAEYLVVLGVARAEERGREREVAVDRVLHLIPQAGLDQLQAEILAELGMELLLGHGDAAEVAQRMEAAVEQILHLEDLGVIGDGLDHAELRPGLELELEDRQRPLHLGVHLLGRNADLVRQGLEAHVVMVLLHGHAAGQPFGVGRGGEMDGRLVEHLRSVQLVDRVADHDLVHGALIFLRLLGELGDRLHFQGCSCRHRELLWFRESARC
jgi:hypothetical protein